MDEATKQFWAEAGFEAIDSKDSVKYRATATEFKETLDQAQRIIDGDEPFEPEDCEGCNYSPCLCHVPQSERWEGR